MKHRDKLLAALKDQTEAQKTRAISLSDAETALRNRAVKLDDREATLAIGQFALAEAQNQVEEEAKRIAANGRDAADQFMTALRRGLTEIALREIDSDADPAPAPGPEPRAAAVACLPQGIHPNAGRPLFQDGRAESA